MAERYTKVFELPENIYAENSPVIIVAGALLKDNQTEQILAQLKVKNVTDKKIIALKVSIVSYDTAKNVIGEELIYNYLDLSADRDDEFGQKIPVLLGNNLTRSFTVKVTEIVFADDCIWHDEGKEWKSLIKPKKLEDVFGDSQLANQYKIEYGEMSEYEVVTDRDLWICSCGHINHKSEKQCLNCNNSFDILTSINLEELNEKKNLRILKEQKEYEIAQKEKKKKTKILTVIVIFVILAMISGSLLIASYSKKRAKYNEACAQLNESNYSEAIEIFESLGTFDDSDTKLKETKELMYNEACNDINKSNYMEAIKALESLGSFKESKEKLKEAKYNYGLELMDDNNFAEASEYFSASGNYSDSTDKACLAKAKSILTKESEYDEYSNYFAIRDYRKEMHQKFVDAKNIIEKHFSENPKSNANKDLVELYNQITVSLDFHGDWKVVSGAKNLSGVVHDDFEVISFAVECFDNGSIHIYLLCNITNSDNVYLGNYFFPTGDSKEPFRESYDEKTTKISAIKNNKITIKNYFNGNILILEKI